MAYEIPHVLYMRAQQVFPKTRLCPLRDLVPVIIHVTILIDYSYILSIYFSLSLSLSLCLLIGAQVVIAFTNTTNVTRHSNAGWVGLGPPAATGVGKATSPMRSSVGLANKCVFRL